MQGDDAQARPVCSNCGGGNDHSHRFCGWCGSKVPPAAVAAFDSIAERKQVTILFADVVGSTAMLDGFDPERSTDLIDPVLSEMATIISAHSGFVGAAAGDGLKALFGVPVATKDHAERGCFAALQIREMARRRQVCLRIGLHSGEVVLRHLRPDVFAEFDGVGLAVHVAARMEQAARPGTILLSAATAALVEQRVLLRRRGPLTVKGLRHTVEVFELVRLADGQGRTGVRSRTRMARFIGRKFELDALLNGIAEGEGVITISGTAGSGKSRLLSELLRRREMALWTVLRVEVDAEDHRVSLRPFIRMLKLLLGVGPNDNASELAGRLDALLIGLQGVAGSDVDALRRLLEMPPTIMSASYQPSRVLRSLQAVLVGYAARHATLLAVEDVHWLDEDGVKLLNLLSADAGDGRLVLLQTLRAFPPGLSRVGRHIALAPLSAAASKQLLDAAMGSEVGLLLRKNRILERADGIPLFLIELAKYAAVSAGGEDEFPVPGTIKAVIGERIDRLPLRCRELLRVAAVIGREVPLALLCCVMLCNDASLEPTVGRLEQEDFLRCRDGPGGPSLAFSHVLSRDVAYSTMIKATRRQIHRAVLDAYERLYPARLDEYIETLGAHALAACDWDRAITYLQRAAEKAVGRSAHLQAIAFTSDALAALTEAEWLPEAKKRRELDLRLLLRVAYNAVGNYKDRLVNLDRAETLASELGMVAILPSLWVSRASVMLQLGKGDEAIELCTRARSSASRRDDVATGIIAGYMLSRNYFYAGRLAASLASGARTLALMGARSRSERHGGGFGSSEVMLYTQCAQSYACRGQFASAHQSALQAVVMAGRNERNFDAALAAYGLGVVNFYEGNVAGSVAALEEGLKASTADGGHSIYAALAGLLSYAYFRAGRSTDGLRLCRDALAYAENSLYFSNWPRLFGSLLLGTSGDTDEAIGLARTVNNRARTDGYPVQAVWSSLVLGHLYRRIDGRMARRCLDRALAESRRMGVRPCQARALIELGNIQQARGDIEGAGKFWRKGNRLATAIGLRTDGDAPFFTPEYVLRA